MSEQIINLVGNPILGKLDEENTILKQHITKLEGKLNQRDFQDEVLEETGRLLDESQSRIKQLEADNTYYKTVATQEGVRGDKAMERITELQAVVDMQKQEMWDCEHNEDFMGHDSAYPKQQMKTSDSWEKRILGLANDAREKALVKYIKELLDVVDQRNAENYRLTAIIEAIGDNQIFSEDYTLNEAEAIKEYARDQLTKEDNDDE